MKKRRLRNIWDNIREYVPFTLGFLSSILTLCGEPIEFNNKRNIMSAVIIIISVLLLVSNDRSIKARDKLWSGLTLLAKDGHIHTTRMILIRDYLEMQAQDDNFYIDITQQNDFVAESAQFSYLVSESVNKLSDIEYCHTFNFRTLHKREQCFKPWFFGEDEAVPEECYIRINDDNWSRITAYPVIDKSWDYAVNEGIFETSIPLGYMKKKEKVHVALKYVRRFAYHWDREEIFVIWPKCFAKKITQASFSVIYIGETNKVVRLIEYVCHGKKPIRNDKAIFTRHRENDGNNIKTIYQTDNIKIDVENVYLIYVTETE